MHVHLPKPLHGWREFFGEVGIIVLGVLVALAAEQLVERWHWGEQANEARGALRSEIREDNLPQAYSRLALAPCVSARLDELQQALDEHQDRAKLAALTRAYDPPLRTWDDEAWKAVVATGVLAHGGAEELILWSLPYRMVVVLGPRNVAEHDDVLNLRSISRLPGALSPVEQDRVTVALEHLREDERRMVSGSKVLLTGARQAGVQLTVAQQRRILADLRPDWGPCVAEPHWRTFDPNTQSQAALRS